ncbi:MAG: helix-turn-helix domain-containing protein, partial [Bacteroidota bacterium]
MAVGKNQNDRIIFGLKVKQLRQEKGLSFADLSKQSGLSISYLNEIEKGKKFPKAAKIVDLAAALDTQAEELTDRKLSGSLAPVGDLLHSNFLNELPLDLFGIELSKVVEIIANAPLRVGAFISTLMDLARNFSLREENFYQGALRSYQEMHYNYFEDIEEAASRFVEEYQLPKGRAVPLHLLIGILEDTYGYKIVENGLEEYPELQHLRAVYIQQKNRLLLQSGLTQTQRAFQLAKELGFQYLELGERSASSSLLKVRSFEEVLNHFRAAYFGVAILIHRDSFKSDLQSFFARKTWDGQAFIGLMKKYRASPEMLFQRLTNLIPRFFGLEMLFSLRFKHDPVEDSFQIDKELHLNRHHHPHGNQISEHYCRRWMSLSLLKDLHQMQTDGKYVDTIVGAQRSRYYGTGDEY